MRQRESKAELQNVSLEVSTSGTLDSCKIYNLLFYSKSTMSKLISRYFGGYSRLCRCNNCICEPDVVPCINLRQVVVFEVSFEDREGVFDGIVIRRVRWWEKFDLYAVFSGESF